jgi:hypothetical protein
MRYSASTRTTESVCPLKTPLLPDLEIFIIYLFRQQMTTRDGTKEADASKIYMFPDRESSFSLPALVLFEQQRKN